MRTRGAAWVVTALAAAAWVAAAVLPWLHVEGSSETLGRRELLASGVPYERALAAAPLAALPIALVTVVAAAMGDKRAGSARWGAHAGGIVLTCGALALVAGCRMLGFVGVRAFDRGEAQVLPGPAPIMVALAGLACALWGWRSLSRAGACVPMSAVVAYGTLVTMPFIPFGASGSGEFLYDELSIAATTASGPGVLRGSGQALAWMRTALWVTTIGGLVWAVGATSLPRLHGWGWRAALLAAGPLFAMGFCGLFLARWAAVDGLGLSWNVMAPLGTLASAGLAAWPLRPAAGRRGHGAMNQEAP